MNTSRRDFIASLALSSLGVSILPNELLASVTSGAKAKHVISIFLNGGVSHREFMDPKENGDGPYSSIETVVSNLKFSQHLKGMAARADKMAIIRSMHSNSGSHLESMYLNRTSYNMTGSTIHPHLGSWICALTPDNNSAIPKDVTISAPSMHMGSGWMSRKYAPLGIINPNKGIENGELKDLTQFDKRLDILRRMNKMTSFGDNAAAKEYAEFYDSTIKLLESKDLEIFDISKESPALKAKYGNNKIGSAMLLARRLVQNGVKFIEVNDEGFDTHSGLVVQLDKKLPEFDMALSALIDDLQENGLLASTIITLHSDFGRGKWESVGGRNHSPSCWSVALIGAGVRQGTVYGASDNEGNKAVENPVTIPDFNATILAAMGINPETTLVSPERRSFMAANRGKIIREVLI